MNTLNKLLATTALIGALVAPALAGLPPPPEASLPLADPVIGHWCTVNKAGVYALANAGHDTRALQAWLGHKNIQHTVRYTELAPDRFKSFWR